jgi:mono/diheme cytochrome c family protein
LSPTSPGNAKIKSVKILLRRTLGAAAAVLLALIAVLPMQLLANSSTPTDEMAGAVLYRDKGCAHCHGASLEGTKKAPPLVDIHKDKVWTPAKMTEQILNGGQKMPPFADSLTDQEVTQIVAYLRAKHPPVPPPPSSATQ